MKMNEINAALNGVQDVDDRVLTMDHVRDAVSAANKGIKRLRNEEDARAKISAANSNVLKSEEHKEKLRQASINAPKYECHQCHGFFYASAIKRWHNENCKPKIDWNKVPRIRACNVCGVSDTAYKIARWHNENCGIE